MAIYNEILAARYAAMLQRLLGMKGEQAVKQLSGEMMAVFPMYVGREMRVLEGWNTFAWFTNIPAGAAGNFSVFRFRNPIGSGVIDIIEKIYVNAGGTGLASITFDPTVADQADLGTVAGAQSLDSRNPFLHQATVLSSKNNTVTQGLGTQIAVLGPFSANTPVDFIITDIQELPLAPGSFYDITAPTAALSLGVTVIFRERVLEVSEKA